MNAMYNYVFITKTLGYKNPCSLYGEVYISTSLQNVIVYLDLVVVIFFLIEMALKVSYGNT